MTAPAPGAAAKRTMTERMLTAIENQGFEILEFAPVQRPPIEIAMLYCHGGRGALQCQHRVP